MKGRMRKSMQEAGFTPSKEYAKLSLLLLLGALLIGLTYWAFGLSFVLAIPALGLILGLAYFFSRYPNAKAKQEQEEMDEFVRLFSFFSVYIDDGYNVYSALKEVTQFATKSLKDKLEKLVSDIDQDKSVTPFAEFGASLSDPKAKDVMVAIYQMVDEGSNIRYLEQFHRQFGKLSQEKHDLRVKRKLSGLEGLSFLPLVGAGISLLMLALSVAQVIGGIVGGL